jgi:hypothetical protein
MNEEELKRLTEKYYNGESTEEEERTIRDFFRKNVIPDGYETEKEIFSYYTESADVPEPKAGFEERIQEGINTAERERKSFMIRKYLLPILSTAAGLLILTGSYFLFIRRSEIRDTFTDPELAYAETMKILRDVSSQLNIGVQVLEPIGKINEMKKISLKTINSSTRLVEKNLKNLDYLQKAFEINHFPVDQNVNK